MYDDGLVSGRPALGIASRRLRPPRRPRSARPPRPLLPPRPPCRLRHPRPEATAPRARGAVSGGRLGRGRAHARRADYGQAAEDHRQPVTPTSAWLACRQRSDCRRGETWLGSAGKAEFSPDRALDDDDSDGHRQRHQDLHRRAHPAAGRRRQDRPRRHLRHATSATRPRKDKVTMRQLLSHTSGIYNFWAQPALRRDHQGLVAEPRRRSALRLATNEWTYEEMMKPGQGRLLQAGRGLPVLQHELPHPGQGRRGGRGQAAPQAAATSASSSRWAGGHRLSAGPEAARGRRSRALGLGWRLHRSHQGRGLRALHGGSHRRRCGRRHRLDGGGPRRSGPTRSTAARSCRTRCSRR